jgi:hypothetical protein
VPSIIDNFERAKKFISTDDIVADVILKEIPQN